MDEKSPQSEEQRKGLSDLFEPPPDATLEEVDAESNKATAKADRAAPQDWSEGEFRQEETAKAADTSESEVGGMSDPTLVHARKPNQGMLPELESEATIPPVSLGFCAYCNAERLPDANFCANCGNPFLTENRAHCRHCQTPVVPNANYCYNCGKSVTPVPPLVMRLIENNRTYTLKGEQDAYTVGRTVPQQNNYTDLTRLGHRKISRQHARIVLHDNHWYLEDMNSKAGTRIFNSRLEPYQPTLLEDGMIVYFADIKFKVELG